MVSRAEVVVGVIVVLDNRIRTERGQEIENMDVILVIDMSDTSRRDVSGGEKKRREKKRRKEKRKEKTR